MDPRPDEVDRLPRPMGTVAHPKETHIHFTVNKAQQTHRRRSCCTIAVQLKRLQSAVAPVLWRPLHEAEGGWFWWGRNKDYNAGNKLWALLYDRLTRYHNLIRVWNSLDRNWYPGDSTVDIVSADLYPSAGDHSAQSGSYNTLKSLVNDRKPVALSECGVIPDPGRMQSAGMLGLFSPVSRTGNFITDGKYNSRSFLTSMCASSWVLNLDEINGWKTGGGVGAGGTTVRPPTTSASGNSGTAVLWGQCGGQGWTGPTRCPSGSSCQSVSPPWYSQCRP